MQMIAVLLASVVLVLGGVILLQNVLFHRERQFWLAALHTKNLPGLTFSRLILSQKKRPVYAEDIREMNESERIAAPKAPPAPTLDENDLNSEEEEAVEYLMQSRGMSRDGAIRMVRDGVQENQEQNLVSV